VRVPGRLFDDPWKTAGRFEATRKTEPEIYFVMAGLSPATAMVYF